MATWAEELAALDAAVTAAFPSAVTFRKTTKGAFTASAGTRAQATGDTAVSIVRNRSSTSRASDGGKRIESTRWYLSAAQLAAGVEPQVNDQLVDGTDTHFITHVARSLDKLGWEIDTDRSIS